MEQCKLLTDNNVYSRAQLITKMSKAKLRYRLEMILSAVMQATAQLYLCDVEEHILELQLDKIKKIVTRKRYQGSES